MLGMYCEQDTQGQRAQDFLLLYSQLLAIAAIGIVAVSPWLPLPAALITGFSQPAILASAQPLS